MRSVPAVVALASLVVAACSGSDDVLQSGSAATTVGAESPAGCPPADGTDAVTQDFSEAPPFCLNADATYSAVISTSVGDVTIDLDQAAAPNGVNNFVFLARNNYFDNTVCHRIIQEFVVQCGDPTATGTGGPGYAFADELPAFGSYTIGSLAMANSGPNTNGSQFFIISGASGAALEPNYSLFGQVEGPDLAVVSEMNALGSLDNSGIPTTELQILDVTITEG